MPFFPGVIWLVFVFWICDSVFWIWESRILLPSVLVASRNWNGFFVEEFGGGFSFQLSFVVVVFELNLLDMSYGLKRSCRAQWALLDLLRLDDDATKEG